MRFAVVALTLAAACYSPVSPGGGSGGSDGGILPGAPVSRFGVGARFACALDGSGGIACWGDDSAGQLADGSAAAGRVGAPAAVPIVGDVAWTDLAVGARHACGLSGGDVYCWGDDHSGEAGGSDDADLTTPTKVLDLSGAFTSLAAGVSETCAIDDADHAWCWGVVGAQAIASTRPVQIPGDYTTVSVGAVVACGVTTDGAVHCWGDCTPALCGAQEAGSGTTLFDFPLGGATAQQVVAGDQEVCAIDTTGALHCAGGDPPIVADGRVWTDLALGPRLDGVGVTCGVSNGSALCWGADTLGGIPDGAWGHPGLSYADAHGIGPATHVALGQVGTGAFDYDQGGCLLDGSAIACWGDDRSGELGDGTGTQLLATVIAPPNKAIWSHQIASSSTHTCAWTETGPQTLYCWGQNDRGQCTGAAGANACPHDICATPVPAPFGGNGPGDLVVGEGFTCVLDPTSERVSCWGDNTRGQLGAPTGGSDGIHDVAGSYQTLVGGGNGACALADSDASAFCWGGWANTAFDDDLMMPTLLQSDLTTLTSLVVADNSACATDAATSRECWGPDAQGQLGDGGIGAPTYFASTSGEFAVGGAASHYCDVRDNAVECWGTSYDLETGLAEDPANSINVTPQPISGTEGNCASIAAGYNFSCASCNDVVTCWGRNAQGATGQPQGSVGTDTATALAVAINGVDFPAPTTIVGGGSELAGHVCVVDGSTASLACWGFGPRGELGTGAHGSPVPVPVSVP